MQHVHSLKLITLIWCGCLVCRIWCKGSSGTSSTFRRCATPRLRIWQRTSSSRPRKQVSGPGNDWRRTQRKRRMDKMSRCCFERLGVALKEWFLITWACCWRNGCFMIFRFLSVKEWLPSAQTCVVLKELLPSWSFGFAPEGSCCLLDHLGVFWKEVRSSWSHGCLLGRTATFLIIWVCSWRNCLLPSWSFGCVSERSSVFGSFGCVREGTASFFIIWVCTWRHSCLLGHLDVWLKELLPWSSGSVSEGSDVFSIIWLCSWRN